MSDCELAYSSFNKPTRVVIINRFEIHRDGPIHPTQKPVKLYRWLLQNYAKAGDKVLDTHCGSASSLVACCEMGIDFIGFEIDKEYYTKAKKRVDAATSQLRLIDFIS